ncbi:MAG TPA: hypothetical protein VKJ47_05160 [Candidatus Binatia bacterium]|nr:hypothetical protein [Candidatus Binatia bacterium]
MTTQPVTVSGDTPYGVLLAVSTQDREHRQAFVAYVLSEAQPFHRTFLTRLYDLWGQWNDRYYDGRLLVPYVTLAEPPAPRVYGVTSLVSSWGGKAEIRLRPSLLKGTHPHVRSEPAFQEGRFLFTADVLLHELGHQFSLEISGETEEPFHGHGPAFRDICNRIGKELGLPPVRSAKKRGPDADLPSCAQWPHNVRPLDYYQGAYVPPAEETEKPTGAPTRAALLARIAALEARMTAAREHNEETCCFLAALRENARWPRRERQKVIDGAIMTALLTAECLAVPANGDTGSEEVRHGE